ncbi:MAG: heavy metal-binding domain-containing protein [Paludibacter sp.]|nr:heavy metal-binding domain-containing protein [Paludibacter sp.]
MKTKFFYSMILVVGLILAGSMLNNVNAQAPKKTATKQATVMYTCPEHPEVLSKKPGKCPKCGMALVVKKDMKKGKMEMKKESTKKASTVKEKAMPM